MGRAELLIVALLIVGAVVTGKYDGECIIIIAVNYTLTTFESARLIEKVESTCNIVKYGLKVFREVSTKAMLCLGCKEMVKNLTKDLYKFSKCFLDVCESLPLKHKPPCRDRFSALSAKAALCIHFNTICDICVFVEKIFGKKS